VLGRYRLHRRLGAGAFGTVWLARDERLDREVAVKIVPRERIVGGRFEREARAAARLAHPGIVTLYEAAVDDDGAYLVSELVRGATLDQLLEEGQLSDRDIVRIVIALCDALSHAHAHGVVHRDVKPSNVLVPDQPASAAQLAKLTDFGVARVLGGDSLTRTGDVVGTAAYMAPEQAEGLQAGAPADLYALALVTYEALTGINPVRTGTAAQRARRLGAHLPPLRRQRRDLPRALGCAIDLALRPRPRERGTIEELRRALVESVPATHDTRGVVTSPWPARAGRGAATPEIDEERWSEPAPLPGGASDPGTARGRRRREETGDDELAADHHAPISWPARGLAATAAAAAAGWLSAQLLAPSSIGPPAAALAAAAVILLLPRIGWLLIAAALTAAASAQGRVGGAMVLALAALVPIVLAPRRGSAWPLSAAAPALGIVGLAGAWPALAARAPGLWRRAMLGATGWAWLLLAAPLDGTGLYLRQPTGSPLSKGAWITSASHTVDQVIKPILSSGALAGAPVWAAAAVVLPYLLRRRRYSAQIVLVTVWAAVTVSGTETAIRLVHPSSALLGSGTACAGAVACGLVALAPGAVRAWRVGRARTELA
jgi:hypothetical protein